MRVLVLLVLSACAQAKPTADEMPMNLRYGPFYESIYDVTGKLKEVHTFKLTADGKYWRHIIRHASGIVEERVFPVVPFRTSPSNK